MIKAYVYACSNDACWREIVKKAEDEFLLVDGGQWPPKSDDQHDRFANLKSKSLVLIDTFQHRDIKATVQSLRDQGWDHVVVVARSPSAVEAHAVLYGNLGYDYWKKTYIVSEVRADIDVCLEEMECDYSAGLSVGIVAAIGADYARREWDRDPTTASSR